MSSLGVSDPSSYLHRMLIFCAADTKCGRVTSNAFGILGSRLKNDESLFKAQCLHPTALSMMHGSEVCHGCYGVSVISAPMDRPVKNASISMMLLFAEGPTQRAFNLVVMGHHRSKPLFLQ